MHRKKEEGHARTEADIGMTHPQAKQCQGLIMAPEVRTSVGQILFQGLQKKPTL